MSNQSQPSHSRNRKPVDGNFRDSEEAGAKSKPCPTPPESLPSVGMSRWGTLRHFVPISRESWRKLVNSGRAPKPVKLSERCSMWPNAEIHRWLADPVSYRQEKRNAQ
jgi:prophage regulatory protein